MKTTLAKWMGLLVVAAIWALTSCGAGAGIGLENASPVSLDDQIQSGSGLPGLPDDRGGERKSSAADITTVLGSEAIQSLNSAVVDTTLVLTGTETDMAWGLYKVEGLAGRKVTGLNIEILTAPGSSYGVGVSNFSEGVWDFVQTGSLPEFEVDFTDEMSRLTSQIGNLYFVVVTGAGQEATMVQASLLSRPLELGEVELPAFGRELSVSEGLVDKIVVQWAAVDGAESYELWREEDLDNQDEVPALLATIPAVVDQASYSYEDFAIVLETEYKYRIRAINTAGPGEFTRWRSGWAGTTPPIGEDPADELELTGAIEAIDEAAITVGGVSFAINPATIWLGGDEQVLTQAEFTVGLTVEIKGDSNGSGGWNARKVQLEDPAVDEMTVLGSIEVLEAESLTVNGSVFAITVSTEWLDINGVATDASAFIVGDKVEVTADSDGLGGWNARVVKAEDAGAIDELTQTGAIEEISELSLSVNATAFAITIDTVWLDNAGLPALPADFVVGTMVEVTGSADGLGGWNAQVVKMQDAGGDNQIEVMGEIAAVDAGSITVDGTTFVINEATELEDLNHDPVGIEAFTVGMLVSVQGDADGEGGWIATRIRMED